MLYSKCIKLTCFIFAAVILNVKSAPTEYHAFKLVQTTPFKGSYGTTFPVMAPQQSQARTIFRIPIEDIRNLPRRPNFIPPTYIYNNQRQSPFSQISNQGVIHLINPIQTRNGGGYNNGLGNYIYDIPETGDVLIVPGVFTKSVSFQTGSLNPLTTFVNDELLTLVSPAFDKMPYSNVYGPGRPNFYNIAKPMISPVMTGGNGGGMFATLAEPPGYTAGSSAQMSQMPCMLHLPNPIPLTMSNGKL